MRVLLTIGVLALFPAMALALEQTCRGCLDACRQSHGHNPKDGTCKLLECEKKHCPKCLDGSATSSDLALLIPFVGRAKALPPDYSVSGQPPLVFKEGQVFVDGVEVKKVNQVPKESKQP